MATTIANVEITAVSITPQTVNVAEQFSVSVTIEPREFAIVNSSGYAITNANGDAIITTIGE